MNKNWKTYKLGEVGRIVTGKTPSTADSENFGAIYPFITPKDMIGQKNIFKTERFLSEKGKVILKNNILPKNTVCVSCIGSDLGKVVMTTKDSLTNQQLNSIICNKDFDADFIYYSTLLISDILRSIGKSSTAVPIVNKSQFSEFEITAPVLSEQKQIASILSSLDDKMELNLQMNQTLEAMAQAIFKEWFVNFNFPGFDGKMENYLPKGWRMGKLSEIIEVKNGYAFKGTDFIDEGIPVIKIKNVKPSKILMQNLSYVSCEVASKAQRYRIDPEDILITMSGNRIDGTPDTWVGKVAIFNRDGEFLLNQRVSILKLKDKNISIKYYLNQLLSSYDFQYYFITNATSSGGQANISPDLIYRTVITIPDNSALEVYNNTVGKLFQRIFSNELENETLTQLRDRLLPKLMSGKITVNA